MKVNVRLIVCGIVILISAIYALLIKIDERFARDFIFGYMAILLTLVFAIQFWKKK
jgi:hypothetical protein